MKRKTKQRIAAFHYVLGLIILIPLFIASISGTALVFRDELEIWLEPQLHLMDPDGETLALDILSASVSEQINSITDTSTGDYTNSGDADISYLTIPDRQYRSWQFVLTDETVVYVNPFNGKILGRQHMYAGAAGWLYDLHSNYLTGRKGEIVLGIVGIASLLLFMSGLTVWLKRKQPWKYKFRYKKSGSFRRRVFDIHKLSGVVLGVLLALSAATGAGLVFYGTFSQITYGMAGKTPPAYPVIELSNELGEFSPSRAYRSAKEEMPNGTLKRIVWPTSSNRTSQVRFRQSNEVHPNGMSFVYVDSRNYEVISVHRASEVPASARINHWLYPLHSGKWAWWDAVLIITGLGGLLLCVTGLLNTRNMKWKNARAILREWKKSKNT